MKGKVLFLSVFLWRTVCSEYCQALHFMCKPKLVTQNTSKHIARWLQKVQAMPDCFLGEEKETVELEDGSVEVMTLSEGVRSGVAVRFTNNDQKHLLAVTLYREGQHVGPVWDLTMGRGYNASYHFHPMSSTVLSSMQADIILSKTGLNNMNNK